MLLISTKKQILASQNVTKDYSIVYVCGAHVQMPITTAKRAWHVCVCGARMHSYNILLSHFASMLCALLVQARCPWGTVVEMVMEQQQC